MTEDLGYKDLCPAVLFNIASFVTGDVFRDLDDERSLKRPRTEELILIVKQRKFRRHIRTSKNLQMMIGTM